LRYQEQHRREEFENILPEVTLGPERQKVTKLGENYIKRCLIIGGDIGSTEELAEKFSESSNMHGLDNKCRNKLHNILLVVYERKIYLRNKSIDKGSNIETCLREMHKNSVK
jgi:hypothetical protein